MVLHVAGQEARLDILEGALRGVANDEAACRLILAGDPPAMAGLACTLAGQVTLAAPRAGLAARAIARAADREPPPRQLGAPEIPPGLSVAEALVLVISHLTDVILHWAALIPRLPEGGADPEPVHQLRVAVRRLRSALAIFRRATAGPDAAQIFRDLGGALKALAAILGTARDWDVFLDGTGAAVAEAFAADKRITALMAAAGRKRQAAYGALHAHLASRAWRDLALHLALLPAARPWVPPSPLPEERDEYGELRTPDPHASKRVTAAGEDFESLPPEAMHEARKQAKQLRYACEFFAPLFPAKPVKRFLERLEDVQEALGAVNDGHVAAALMAQLAAGPDGRFAAGVVQGFVAAVSAPAARRAGKAWAKLVRQSGFWD
jgi:CHAD domain-containing protein